MYSMIQNRFKAPVTAFITPSCRFLLKIGITANWLTFIGALGSSVSALYFFSYGDFFLGTIFVSLFALSDLFDGMMARHSERGTIKWGGGIFDVKRLAGSFSGVVGGEVRTAVSARKMSGGRGSSDAPRGASAVGGGEDRRTALPSDLPEGFGSQAADGKAAGMGGTGGIGDSGQR